jgi:hypothetical protein
VCALAYLLLLMGEIEYGARGSSFLGDDWYFKTLDLDGEIMLRGLPRDSE